MNILSNNAKVISKHYFGRRHFGYELHEFILRSLEKLIDHPEDLLLGQLVIESLDELIHRPEVCLDLLLSVLVHAQLHLSGLAAVHEALDLAEVAHWSVVVGGSVLLLQAGGQRLRHLVAAVKNLHILVFKPLARHLDGLLLKSKYEHILRLPCIASYPPS